MGQGNLRVYFTQHSYCPAALLEVTYVSKSVTSNTVQGKPNLVSSQAQCSSRRFYPNDISSSIIRIRRNISFLPSEGPKVDKVENEVQRSDAEAEKACGRIKDALLFAPPLHPAVIRHQRHLASPSTTPNLPRLAVHCAAYYVKYTRDQAFKITPCNFKRKVVPPYLIKYKAMEMRACR